MLIHPFVSLDSNHRRESSETRRSKNISGKWSRRALFVALLMVFSACSNAARAQGLEVGGGYSHVTGDFGTNGFNVGAAWWATNRVTLGADYDSTWNSSTLGVFAFTQTGSIAVKSHLQTIVAGPRIFFSTKWTTKHKLNPFGEAQFGASHLQQKVTQVNMPTVSASDTAFTWMLGGGAEYLIASHWSARANMDFLRTHFSNSGQSHFRLVLGIRYTFGER